MITSARPATTAAACAASVIAFAAGPLGASSRASQMPAAVPPTAASTHSGIVSAAVSRSNCTRVTPRAISIAVSPSR